MDKLISYFPGFAIVEHEGKWYCPSKIRQLDPGLKSFNVATYPEFNFGQMTIGKNSTPINVYSIKIQANTDDIFFAYCKEADTLGVI